MFHDFQLSWVVYLKTELNQQLPPNYYARVEQNKDELCPSIYIRSADKHQQIALVEILSPENKQTKQSINKFVDKAITVLQVGVHLVIVDMFPPGLFDSDGIHEMIWKRLNPEVASIPLDKPFRLTSYMASNPVTAFVENISVGEEVPSMPLFLGPDRYLILPLAKTYESVVMAMPRYSRDLLEGKSS